MLEHFEKAMVGGDRATFFKLWQEQVPKDVRQGLPDAQRVEFYLQVYFALFPMMFSKGLKAQTKVRSRKDRSPIKAVPVSIDEAMRSFKQYLESNRGQDLAKIPEFLQYYALPFIPDLTHHPTFGPLVSQRWIDQIQELMLTFLESTLVRCRTPALMMSFLQGREDQRLGIENNLLRQQLSSIQQEYAFLLRTSSELADMLEQSIRGQAVDIPHLTEVSNRLMEATSKQQKQQEATSAVEQEIADKLNQIPIVLDPALTTAVPTVATQQAPLRTQMVNSPHTMLLHQRMSTAGAALQHATRRGAFLDEQGTRLTHTTGANGFGDNPMLSTQTLNLTQQQVLTCVLQPQMRSETGPPIGLNLEKVKIDLVNLRNRELCVLLQALRWRMIRARPGPQRQELMMAYLGSDLLGCGTQDLEYSELVWKTLLKAKDLLVREYTVRLINCLASLAAGRSYFVTSKYDLLGVLQQILKAEREDTVTRQNALGALQTLSLRRFAQTRMIGEGVIKWLLETLQNLDTLSDYSAEYATALLMNLSLRTVGRQAAAKEAALCVTVLIDLLEHESQQIRTYANGTLYSLLAENAVRQEAEQRGLHDILIALKSHSEEHLAQQIDFILARLSGQKEHTGGAHDDDTTSRGEYEFNDDDDDDAGETEDDVLAGDDLDDTIIAVEGEKYGDELLVHKYGGTGFPPVNLPMDMIVGRVPATIPAPEERPTTPLDRPTTPTRVVNLSVSNLKEHHTEARDSCPENGRQSLASRIVAAVDSRAKLEKIESNEEEEEDDSDADTVVNEEGSLPRPPSQSSLARTRESAKERKVSNSPKTSTTIIASSAIEPPVTHYTSWTRLVKENSTGSVQEPDDPSLIFGKKSKIPRTP
eukprot:Clim_evm2s201 gene=Clim_evmTU2s201